MPQRIDYAKLAEQARLKEAARLEAERKSMADQSPASPSQGLSRWEQIRPYARLAGQVGMNMTGMPGEVGRSPISVSPLIEAIPDQGPNERLVGRYLGGARAVENVLKPETLGLGAAASLVPGVPGMLLGAGFSANMLKDATKQYEGASQEGISPREQAAGRTTATLDALLAVFPWLNHYLNKRAIAAKAKPNVVPPAPKPAEVAPAPTSNPQPSLIDTAPIPKGKSQPIDPVALLEKYKQDAINNPLTYPETGVPAKPAMPDYGLPPSLPLPPLPEGPEFWSGSLRLKGQAGPAGELPAIPEGPTGENLIRGIEGPLNLKGSAGEATGTLPPNPGLQALPPPETPVGGLGLTGKAEQATGNLPALPVEKAPLKASEPAKTQTPSKVVDFRQNRQITVVDKKGHKRTITVPGANKSIIQIFRSLRIKLSPKGGPFNPRTGKYATAYVLDQHDVGKFRDDLGKREFNRIFGKDGKANQDDLALILRENGFNIEPGENAKVLEALADPKRRQMTADQWNGQEENYGMDEQLQSYITGLRNKIVELEAKTKSGQHISDYDDSNFPDDIEFIGSGGPNPKDKSQLSLFEKLLLGEGAKSQLEQNAPKAGEQRSMVDMFIPRDKETIPEPPPLPERVAKQNPLMDLKNQISDTLQKSHTQAENEAKLRILGAPKSSHMSKREILGLDKPKRKAPKMEQATIDQAIYDAKHPPASLEDLARIRKEVAEGAKRLRDHEQGQLDYEESLKKNKTVFNKGR
jgi:hypothetical protein